MTEKKEATVGGFFLTQKGEKINEVKKEIAELEALLAGAAKTSQSTLLLKKRKEMREVDEALDLMKEEYKTRMDSCEEHRIQFESKQAKMREQVLKFEKFIQENDAKRQRADMKAKLEHKMFDQKVQELGALADKIVELENNQKELEQQLKNKACYREYLEKYIDVEESNYEEVNDVLNRYKTLRDANGDLMRHVNELENDVDELRKDLQQLKIETQNSLLVSNSQFQQCQKKLEETRARTKLEEKDKDLHQDKSKDIARETSQVIQTIRNIFSRCQATMRNKINIVSANKDASMHEQLIFNLDVIHARISDLIEITNECKNGDNGDNESNPGTVDLREMSGLYTASTAGPQMTSQMGGNNNNNNNMSSKGNLKQSFGGQGGASFAS